MFKITNKSYSTEAVLFQKAKEALDVLLLRKDLGFFQLPKRNDLWNEIEKMSVGFREKCDDLVVVGIGGSCLGAKVIQEIFQSPKSEKKLYFCDNVDSLEFTKLFESLGDLVRTGWLFISKSGSTIETIVSADYILEVYRQKHLNLPPICAITENRSNPLFDWARDNQVPILEIPIDVGGRFSVLTAVGMLPAGFLGLDIRQFQDGAFRATENHFEIADFTAQTLMSFSRGEWISLFWFYSSSCKNFGAWLQQLWAESLGKKVDRSGQPAPRVSSPFTAVGVCDQHSVLQQVMEGARDKFVCFVRVQSSEKGPWPLSSSKFANNQFFVGKQMGQLLAAEAEATQKALAQEGVSSIEMSACDLSPASVGYLFMFWELVVGTLGEVLNINAFNQPGVELGKRLAKEILK